MNTSTFAEHRRTVRLPLGYSCTFVCGPEIDLRFEWKPAWPRIRNPRARRKFFEAYVVERDAFVAEVATMLGGAIFIADATRHGIIRTATIGPEARQ